VGLGAFGAHGLASRIGPEGLASWATAVDYQLAHALAVLSLGLFERATGRGVALPAGLFVAGVVLFSGSIYALVLGGPRALGPVTPLGGLCLLAAWASLVRLARR
jgi:uncharacterized membrane protein YgdD (TMEM256/DUF423 family)